MNLPAHSTAPLLVTLQLDPDAFTLFNGLRQQHFPAAINYVPAHISLFHHLPGEEIEAVRTKLQQASSQTALIPLRATGVRGLGRGVAYTVVSNRLLTLHSQLVNAFAGWLTAQDRQPYKPHVTVQNKVQPQEAQALLRQLQAQFAPFEFTGQGLYLWRYLRGPWELVETYPFRA